jgi:hypothetical protein
MAVALVRGCIPLTIRGMYIIQWDSLLLIYLHLLCVARGLKAGAVSKQASAKAFLETGDL